MQLTSSRLARALLVAALIPIPRSAAPQTREPGAGRASVKGSLYIDDDDTQIVTTLADAQVALPGSTTVGAHVLVDVISTASVDVVSAATPSFDEVRVEFGARAGIFFTPEVDFQLAFTHSAESDWLAHLPSATLGFDLFERNTRIDVGYGLALNQVGRANDPTFDEQLQSHTAEAGVTQVLGKSTIGGLRYTFRSEAGWQSSPYRVITLRDRSTSFFERHPEARLRHAAVAHLIQHLADGVGLFISYRFYSDDWGIMSHTGTAELRIATDSGFGVRLRGRGYYQDDAYFWHEHYEQPLKYMSADRELSAFWDLGGGVKLSYEGEHWKIDLKVDATRYEFMNFARLQGRVAIVADLGVSLNW